MMDISLFATVWNVPSVPVEQPKLAQWSTAEKGLSFLFLRSAAILGTAESVILDRKFLDVRRKIFCFQF